MYGPAGSKTRRTHPLQKNVSSLLIRDLETDSNRREGFQKIQKTHKTGTAQNSHLQLR
jgi:hypothetical protein